MAVKMPSNCPVDDSSGVPVNVLLAAPKLIQLGNGSLLASVTSNQICSFAFSCVNVFVIGF